MCCVVNYNILINDIYLKNVNVSFHFLSILPCNTLLHRRIINGIVELFSEKKAIYSTVRPGTHRPMRLTQIYMLNMTVFI